MARKMVVQYVACGLYNRSCPCSLTILKSHRFTITMTYLSRMRQYHRHHVQGKAWLSIEIRRSRNSTCHALKEAPSPKDSRRPYTGHREEIWFSWSFRRSIGETIEGEAEVHSTSHRDKACVSR
jgi:hypothetical protein